MNVLFLDAYYEPEIIAYTHLENDLIEGLINSGHKVKIICPVPTRGIDNKTRQKYKKIKSEKKYNGNVLVKRFNAPREVKNPIIRAFRYFWCNLRTYQIAIRCKNIDVVFANSTPPTQGLLGVMVAKKLSKNRGCKVPFVYNLQDIFPDSLVSSGLSHEGSIFWRIGRYLEDFTYNHTDKIILISEGFKKNIMAKGVLESKIEVISNWIDLDSVFPVIRKENNLIYELGLDATKFIVVYAGNFGAAQGADILLKAAKKMKDYNDIQFVIFGGGAYFEDAKKEASGMENVLIYDLMSQDRIAEVYSLGNVAIITCKKGTGKAGLPSKTWSIMACNTPIIASFDTDSDLAEILAKSNAGICVEANNTEALTNAIIDYYEQYISKKTKNVNLRDFVYENASKQSCVKRYVESIAQSTIKNT